MQQLRRLSAKSGRSIADLVRQGVDEYLAGKGNPAASDRIARAIKIAGAFSSGCRDVNAKHDRHLAEVFRR
jgi:hypothetical protein